MISFPVAFAIISAILSILGRASCRSIKYDQRQEGDLNFRTDVEDVFFVIIPPKDLISSGMGIVAATAANFLKNSYGSNGIDSWPLRSPSKIGFAPFEKSPYKIDLEGQKMNVKKVKPIGEPNIYNVYENKKPSKGVAHINFETFEESIMKSSTTSTTTTTTTTTAATTAKIQESTTENKVEKKNFTVAEKKESIKEEKMKAKPLINTTEAKTKTESPLVVVGEFSNGGLGPESIFAREGCGPDAYRDKNGLCVYRPVNKKT